jgi:hypothetical protein
MQRRTTLIWEALASRPPECRGGGELSCATAQRPGRRGIGARSNHDRRLDEHIFSLVKRECVADEALREREPRRPQILTMRRGRSWNWPSQCTALPPCFTSSTSSRLVIGLILGYELLIF